MLGLVSVRTPSYVALLRITVSYESHGQIQAKSERSESINLKTNSLARCRPLSPSSLTSRAKLSSNWSSGKKKSPPEKLLIDESLMDNPDLGPFLLKLARDTIASRRGPNKTLDYALPAAKLFEKCAVEGEPSLDLVMSLHVMAAIYRNLWRFEEVIPVLERAISVPIVPSGADHILLHFQDIYS